MSFTGIDPGLRPDDRRARVGATMRKRPRYLDTTLPSARTHPADISGAASDSDISTVPSADTVRWIPESSWTAPTPAGARSRTGRPGSRAH